MSVNEGPGAKKRKIGTVDREDDGLLYGSSRASSSSKTISIDWLSSSQQHLRSRDLTGQHNGKPITSLSSLTMDRGSSLAIVTAGCFFGRPSKPLTINGLPKQLKLKTPKIMIPSSALL